MFGHYTAYIRPTQEDQAWYYADDSCVQPVRDRDWLETEGSELDCIDMYFGVVILFFHSSQATWADVQNTYKG